jgi:GNAT superfamily N-acetyltransferase
VVMGTVTLRRARPGETSALSDLAMAAKAHWGYDDDFMAACRAELTVGPGDLEPHRLTVAVAAADEQLAGFYGLSGVSDDDAELSALFVAPAFMGQGVGRRLFDDAVRVAAQLGFGQFRIESDPFAAAFYEQMGAVRMGATPSHSIAGRSLPLYRMDTI